MEAYFRPNANQPADVFLYQPREFRQLPHTTRCVINERGQWVEPDELNPIIKTRLRVGHMIIEARHEQGVLASQEAYIVSIERVDGFIYMYENAPENHVKTVYLNHFYRGRWQRPLDKRYESAAITMQRLASQNALTSMNVLAHLVSRLS